MSSACCATASNPLPEDSPMKTRKTLWLLWPLVLLSGCDTPPDATLPATRTLSLPVMTVGAGAPLEYSGVGTLVSDRRIEVASRLSGHIRDITVQEGDRVRAGQVLAQLEASDVESQIRQADAALKVATAAAADAELDAGRYQTLFEKGVVADSDIRKVQLRAGSARESVRQAEAALAAARAQQEYATLRSPIDGQVVARLRRPGDLAVPGMPLLVLEAGGELVFETTVPGQQVSRLQNGQPVAVMLDGLPAPRPGRISRIVSSGDAVTRAYPVRITLDDVQGLRAGMFGRAVFTLGEIAVPVVPRPALAEHGGLHGVYVLDDEQRARFRWLRLGREWADRVEVTAGLQAGERILAAVTPAVQEGDRITPDAAP